MKSESCLPALFKAGLYGLLLFVAAGLACAGIESLRVVATKPAVFDYVFASVVSRASTNPVLAFNHRGGETVLTRVGGRVDTYRVTSYVPRVVEVFNPSVNMKLKEDRSLVGVENTNGETVVLECGHWLEQPGLAAAVARLDTGESWTVQEGDTVRLDATDLVIGAIATNSLVLKMSGSAYVIPSVTDDERTSLALVRRESTRIREEQRVLASLHAREEESRLAAEEAAQREKERQAEARAPKPAPERPSTSIGISDYVFPIQGRTVPFVYALPDGRIRITTFVFPSPFDPCPYPRWGRPHPRWWRSYPGFMW